MDDYVGWGDTLLGAANFLGKGTGFILKDGSYLDDVVDKLNLEKHCAVLKAAYDYYCEVWYDRDEDDIHNDDNRVYKLKMAYIEELDKYAKENEEIWVGYSEERTEMTDYQHLEDYRYEWALRIKSLGELYKHFIQGDHTEQQRKDVDKLIEQITTELIVSIFGPSLKYGNIFSSEDFRKQIEAIESNWDEILANGFNYYFQKIFFVDNLDNPQFCEEAEKFLQQSNLSLKAIKESCEGFKTAYKENLANLK